MFEEPCFFYIVLLNSWWILKKLIAYQVPFRWKHSMLVLILFFVVLFKKSCRDAGHLLAILCQIKKKINWLVIPTSSNIWGGLRSDSSMMPTESLHFSCSLVQLFQLIINAKMNTSRYKLFLNNLFFSCLTHFSLLVITTILTELSRYSSRTSTQ